MSWRDISDGEIDPNSPAVEQTLRAFRDNVKAAFAGNSGAPRLAHFVVPFNITASQDITGFEEYAGFYLDAFLSNVSGVDAKNFTVSLGNAGGVFGTATTVASVGANSAGEMRLFVDARSGAFYSAFNIGGAGTQTGNLALPGGTVTTVRLAVELQLTAAGLFFGNGGTQTL